MQTTKPKIQRTYVRATDADTGKTVAWTIYNATPQQVRDQVEKALKKKTAQSAPEPSAA